jgi:hypothetical protein
MATMVAMEPMAAPDVAHAAHPAPIAHATDVTPTEPEAAAVTSAEAATSEATTTEATTMTAAEATTMTAAAPTASTSSANQQTAPCIKVGAVGIARRLSKRCRGRKSERKSADDTKRHDAAFHDAPLMTVAWASSLQAIGRHLRLATDPPPSGFFLKAT